MCDSHTTRALCEWTWRNRTCMYPLRRARWMCDWSTGGEWSYLRCLGIREARPDQALCQQDRMILLLSDQPCTGQGPSK